MDRECLRTGDRATITLQFMQYPEYVKPGTQLVFRDGRTKAVGKVRTDMTGIVSLFRFRLWFLNVTSTCPPLRPWGRYVCNGDCVVFCGRKVNVRSQSGLAQAKRSARGFYEW
jgi:hypothetical protein